MTLIQIARAAGVSLVALGAMFATAASVDAAPAAPAAAPAAAVTPAPARFNGILASISGDKLTITGADGKASSIIVAKDAWIVKGRPIKASDIKPGDFVATANVNNPDGTGTSVELRVFPPGLHIGEGSYPMDEPNTTMTNATVSGVVDVSDGRELTVTYGASADKGSAAGTRKIKLPANIQVVQWYRVAISDLKIGNRVRGRGKADNGAITADFIFADDPPPAGAPAH
jgi:hypothetical protein